jgi:hypothetical protein
MTLILLIFTDLDVDNNQFSTRKSVKISKISVICGSIYSCAELLNLSIIQ